MTPTPVIGTVGVIEDRGRSLGMRWAEGDEIWLLGEPTPDAGVLCASELAWRRGRRGGIASLDIAAAARVARLVPQLARAGAVTSAHDLSVGGLGVALARMAILAGVGASVSIGADLPPAALFGERVGRVIVGVPVGGAGRLADALTESGVSGSRLGTAGGDALSLRWDGGAPIAVSIERLRAAWETPF